MAKENINFFSEGVERLKEDVKKRVIDEIVSKLKFNKDTQKFEITYDDLAKFRQPVMQETMLKKDVHKIAAIVFVIGIIIGYLLCIVLPASF